MSSFDNDFARRLAKREGLDITPNPTEYVDGMVDELVCLACFERVGYDDATIMEKFRYSYKCPSCEAWMLRVHSGKTHTCTACVQTMPDPTPIARVSITNKNRTTYKYAHLDGSVCKPAAYTPPKGTACLDCGDKKGERFDLSPAGDRDPKKAICFTCYNKFRVSFIKAACKEAAGSATATPSTEDTSGYLNASGPSTKKQRGGGA